ncbi:MAG TPA: hypothetical protein VGP85_09635 [Pyrinomonadaceae bacterium]|nr:hypothetical protein [Pyrinomonadaceae bacterium]
MKTTIANIKLSWVTQRAMGREMINVGLPVLTIEPLDLYEAALERTQNN